MHADEIREEIDRYQTAIDRKWRGRGDRQPGGVYPGLSNAESVFVDMWFFWQGCLENSGDVAGYFKFMDAHKADFVALGACGCLEAIELIRPYYEKAGSSAEWDSSPRKREVTDAEESAFDDDFPALLLAFAKTNIR